MPDTPNYKHTMNLPKTSFKMKASLAQHEPERLKKWEDMDLYYQDDDAYGWLQPIKHEHFDVEKNDPMTAELEHFVDLCLGRETTPRCTGDNALDTLKVINAIQKSAEDETPVKL